MKHIRFYEVDLLRFLAAFMIVLYHFTHTATLKNFVDFQDDHLITSYFYLGISFFFIISGFVILMSAEGVSAKHFVLSRFIRLYPAYWTCVILSSIIIASFGGGRSVHWDQFFMNLTMFHSIWDYPSIEGVYWTLTIELKFYLIILILLLTGGLRYIEHIIALVLTVSLYFIFQPYALASNVWGEIFPHWSGYFAAGGLFYLIRRDGLSVYKSILWILSLVFVIKQSVLLTSMLQSTVVAEYKTIWVVLMSVSFFALFTFIALKESNVFRQRVFYNLGVLSYPLYLIHESIGYILFIQLEDYWNKYLILLLSIILVMGLAFMIHHYVERPLSSWLRKKLLGHTSN